MGTLENTEENNEAINLRERIQQMTLLSPNVDSRRTRSLSASCLFTSMEMERKISHKKSSSTLESESLLEKLKFRYSTSDFNYALTADDRHDLYCECRKQEGKVCMASQLIYKWDILREKNVMNYKLNLLYKLLPGKYNLVAQLNVERGALRRKPQPFKSLKTSFDSRRFSYAKIKFEEVLLNMECTDEPLTTDNPLDRHFIVVNTSPIERGHSLIVPCIQRCLPQCIDETAFRLAIHVMLLSQSTNTLLVYNSLLAFASVNHLHMHLLYWPYRPKLFTCPVFELTSDVFGLRAPESWYVPGFVLQLKGHSDFERFIRLFMQCVTFLIEGNVPHNITIGRAPALRYEDQSYPEPEDQQGLLNFTEPFYVTAYIFPRKPVYGAKPSIAFNPAALELSGCILIYNERFYTELSEPGILRIIDTEAAPNAKRFEELCSGLQEYLTSVNEESQSNPLPSPRPLTFNLHDQEEDATVIFE